MKKLVLIDGSSLVHRAFYALPQMHAPDGVCTNAVYGMAGMVVRLLGEIKPDYTIAAFDKSRITFRNKLFKDYKAHRQETPAELRPQFRLAQELLDLVGISVAELEGYEADDIIGSYARVATADAVQTIIVTGDRDALQLINPVTEVWLTKKGISEVLKVNHENCKQLFGIAATGVVELKALMGDSSDNIPGVRGIGEKTALKLLQEYDTLDGVYKNIEKIKGKLQEKLLEGKETAYLSKELATINTGLSLMLRQYAASVQPDLQGLSECCDRLGFRTLKSRLMDMAAAGAGNVEQIVQALPAVEFRISSPDEITEQMKPGERLALAYRTSGKPPHVWCEMLALATEAGVFLLDNRNDCNEFLENIKTGFSIVVYDLKTLLHAGAMADGFEDIHLLAYVIDPVHGRQPVKELSNVFTAQAGYCWPDDEQGKLATEARVLRELFPDVVRLAAERQVLELYRDMELPLCKVLADMEKNGVCVDLQAAAELQREFSERLLVIETEIYRQAGEVFNINSPKQLGEILFERLGLKAAKKNKSGGYSTDVEVLNGLQGVHPIICLILEYRSIAKLNSTYLEAVKTLADPQTGRVHTSFNQTVTVTGRLSSSDPNLQNIPVKTELGRRIRSLFIPGSDYTGLLSADYSQIELRVLAHLANSAALSDAFRDNADIHSVTAAEVFNVGLSEVTPEMRRRAKAVNFGIVYGQSDYGLSKSINVSRKEAASYIQQYFERYKDVKEYIDSSIETARRKGYAETLFGRKRYLPDINSGNYNTRSFAERTAMNTPVQGTAADIIKMAMLAVQKELKKRCMKSRLLLQVHDELVLEIVEEERFEVELLVQSLMENTVRLAVPLTVDINCGSNWVEAK